MISAFRQKQKKRTRMKEIASDRGRKMTRRRRRRRWCRRLPPGGRGCETSHASGVPVLVSDLLLHLGVGQGFQERGPARSK